MKCYARIRTETRRKKGGGEEYEKVVEFSVLFHKEWPICGGDIEAHISAKDEPVWGDHFAELVVEFRCGKCGCRTYLELPDVYGINTFLTRVVEEMPQPLEEVIE